MRILFVIATLLVSTVAAAQQVPQQIPAGGQQAGQPHGQIPMCTRYPCSAAKYHLYMNWMLDMAKKGVNSAHSPLTQGDLNKFTLRIRDCEGSVEADGYVTLAEAGYCERVIRTMVREIKAAVMASVPSR